MSKNRHHAAGPGGKARSGSQREESMTVASGTAPGHHAAHGSDSKTASFSNNVCIAISVVVSQKKPMCLTSTSPARPHRIPRLKEIPAV